MKQYNLLTKFYRCLFSLLLIAALLLPTQNSFAINDGVRNVTWNDGSHRCNATDLSFDPFDPANKDITWEITNPVCLAYFSAAGTTLAAAEYLSSSACGYVENIVEVSAQMAMMIVLSPMTVVRRFQETNRCLLFSHTFPTCCLTTLQSTIAMGTAVGELGTIYSTAKGAYNNARICGHDWNTWARIDKNGDETPDTSEKNWKKGAYDGSYKKCLQDLFTTTTSGSCDGIDFNDTNRTKSITNKYFREYIYGGKEFGENGDNQCNNPSTWDNKTRLERLGYTDDKQRYYMTGSGNASNYACYRFLTVDLNDDGAREAYDCCVARSQNTVCIESRATFNGSDVAGSSEEHKFCETGGRCNVGGVWYDAYSSQKKSNYVCARTYSVCPYNHPLGGGTEVSKYDSSNNLENFCQVMNHCAKVPEKPYVYNSSLEGGFISQACRNLKGDTQNFYEYESDILGSKRNFSAPMAQCFKETMENLFLNKAGHNECLLSTESPGADGNCEHGNKYHEGESLGTTSFFIMLQKNFQETVKMALTVSIVAFGFSVLLGMSPLTKKQLMTYILKVALVMYFAVGDGWQSGFMTGIIDSSGFLSEMVLSIDESSDESKLDGCQFPRFNYADDDPTTKYTNPSYPVGKEYLRIWDTLDCKLARAIGYGPEVSVPNLVMMIIGGFATGSAGIVFLIASLSFSFFLFSIIIRALHIFILSTMAIVILIYVSPLTITLSMFARTKSIFDAWWKQILGFALQPFILFAYLGLMITFFDKVVIGDATFSGGNGITAAKNIVCNGSAENTSIYCIFRISELKNFTGLEIIGIGMPILKNMNSAKVHTIINGAFLMFILWTFLDKITGFAKDLVGGNEIKNEWKASFTGIAKSSYGALHGFQKRRDRATEKVAKAAFNKVKNAVRRQGTKGGDGTTDRK